MASFSFEGLRRGFNPRRVTLDEDERQFISFLVAEYGDRHDAPQDWADDLISKVEV
jgi:hypothetical protein